MDQNTMLGLMALRDGFGSLRSIGGGPAGPQNALPMAMQYRAQQAEQEKLQQALERAKGGGALPMGMNPAAFDALASVDPRAALGALTQVAKPAASSSQMQLFRERQNNPDFAAFLDSQGKNDPWKGYKVVGEDVMRVGPNGPEVAYRGTPDQSAMQQKISTLMESDPRIDYATAVGIATGRLALDSFSGQILDKVTGRPWSGSSAAPSSPSKHEGSALPQPIVPTNGADYPGATGGQGIVGGLANTVSDFFGGNLPAPEQERASQAFDNLRVRTMTTLQEAVPGRPSNMVIELLGQMTVEGGKINMGAERAEERLVQTRDFISQDVRKLERIIDPSNGFSRNQRADAQMQIEDRRQLLSDYNAIIGQFDAPKEAAQASSAYPDGFLIENDVGDRMVMRNGKWEPVE